MSHLSSRNRGLRSRQYGRYSILEVCVWGHSEPSDHKPEPECQLHHRSRHRDGQDVGEQALDTKDSDLNERSWGSCSSWPAPTCPELGDTAVLHCVDMALDYLGNIPYQSTNGPLSLFLPHLENKFLPDFEWPRWSQEVWPRSQQPGTQLCR